MAAPPSSTWPPSSGLCTPTVSRENAVLTSSYTLRIAAPASEVFAILRDVSKYSQWNSWVPKVTITSEPPNIADSQALLHTGTAFILHVIMNAAKPQSETPTQLRVTDISTPQGPSHYLDDRTLQDPSYSSDLMKVYRISWKSEGGFVSRGLKTERFHEVIVLGERECEVRTWEVMGGMLAYTVKWMFSKTLEEKFELWCTDLKKFAEAQTRPQETLPEHDGL